MSAHYDPRPYAAAAAPQPAPPRKRRWHPLLTGLALLLATLAAVLQFGDLSGLLLVWLVFVLGQLLESMIITPKLVGERIGLHPLVVIFALMAFGQLFGFVGIMLALPISAVLVVLVRLGRLRYLDSRFYRRQRRTTPQGR